MWSDNLPEGAESELSSTHVIQFIPVGSIWGWILTMCALHKWLGSQFSPVVERREKTPTPTLSALLRKSPVLRRAEFTLIKEP